MSDSNYLLYSDSIEQTQPDEAEITELIVASMGRVNRKIFDKHRHALRDAHAKSHGILKGELEVYPNLPQRLRQGIFAMPKRYPVIARLSTAPGDLQSDRIPALFGMAIKVLGVTGKKVLSDDGGHNQDFLLVSYPVMPFGNVASFSRCWRSLPRTLQWRPSAQRSRAMQPIWYPRPFALWRRYPIPTSSVRPFTRWRRSDSGRMWRRSAPRRFPSRSDLSKGRLSQAESPRCMILWSISFAAVQRNTNCVRSYSLICNKCPWRMLPSSGLRTCLLTNPSGKSRSRHRILTVPGHVYTATMCSVSIPGIALKSTGHWAPSCASGSRRMKYRAGFVTR
jgi:hypothetical protein